MWRAIPAAAIALALVLVLAVSTDAQPAPMGLHVVGNQIVDGSNHPVGLRGVNKSGSEYMCLGTSSVFDGPTDQASIDAMRAWQVNVVRLPLNEDCWLGINGQPQSMTTAAYRGAIVDYVGRLNASGIAVIIDLQWAAPSSMVSNSLQPMPDADHAPAFWTSVAETFRGNGSVMFDLFNEPFPDNNADTAAAWTCLRDGGTCPNVGYPAAGMQQLVDVVRATGAQNIVLVPGVQYSNVLSDWLAHKPKDPTGNLAASWHSYNDQVCSGQACWVAQIKPVMQSVPLIVGEIGEHDCQGIYIGPLMDWLDANGGSYLAWTWNTYGCAGNDPSLISDYSGTPTGFGVDFRDHLLAAAGLAVPTPVAIPYFNGGQFPFGINVGSSASYTAPDGTVYLPDVTGDAMLVKADPPQGYNMQPYVTTAGQTGRAGCCALWTINVPNDTYSVTLEAFPTASYPAGEFGQDQTIQGQKVGTCVWSAYPSPSVSPLSGISCPGSGAPGTPTPVQGQPNRVSYTVGVYNQQLSIQVGASFGSGRTTILNSIKVLQIGSGVSQTPTATSGVPTQTPTASPTPTAPTPAATTLPITTPIPCQAVVSINGGPSQLVPQPEGFCGLAAPAEITPTPTPIPPCQVLVLSDAQPTAVSRPAAFCTDQP